MQEQQVRRMCLLAALFRTGKQVSSWRDKILSPFVMLKVNLGDISTQQMKKRIFSKHTLKKNPVIPPSLNSLLSRSAIEAESVR
jgi:hypothetical protein